MIYINATNESIDALVKSVCALLYESSFILLILGFGYDYGSDSLILK